MWKALNFRREIQPFQEIYFQTNSSASLAVGSNETGTGSPPAVGRDSQEWITQWNTTDLHPLQYECQAYIRTLDQPTNNSYSLNDG